MKLSHTVPSANLCSGRSTGPDYPATNPIEPPWPGDNQEISLARRVTEPLPQDFERLWPRLHGSSRLELGAEEATGQTSFATTRTTPSCLYKMHEPALMAIRMEELHWHPSQQTLNFCHQNPHRREVVHHGSRKDHSD